MNRVGAGLLLGGLLGLAPAMPALAQELPVPAAAGAADDALVSDAWITTRIRAALVPVLRDGRNQVQVATFEGVVTLQGEVDDWITHDSVTALATHVRGVRSVDAQALRVGPALPEQ